MDPILLDIPDAFATERLTLRVPRPGDGEAVAASVRASLDELKVWMPWAKEDYATDDSELWCRRVCGEFHTRVSTQFCSHEPGGTHVGNVGAFKFDWKVRSCEVGYWLRTDRIGRGYMSEAVNALVTMLQSAAAIRRIELRCDSQNDRSVAVARRCGFTLEGTLRGDSLGVDQSPRDTHLFARSADR